MGIMQGALIKHSKQSPSAKREQLVRIRRAGPGYDLHVLRCIVTKGNLRPGYHSEQGAGGMGSRHKFQNGRGDLSVGDSSASGRSLMSLLWFALLAMVVLPQSMASDPCSEINEVNDDWRDVSKIQGEKTDYCDGQRFDPDNWYKFTLGSRPASIPTECIKNNMCGSRIAMRVDLNGQQLPLNVGDSINASLCGSYDVLGKYDCCVLRSPVEIARCDEDTFVYKFQSSFDRCPVAICAKENDMRAPPAFAIARQGRNVSLSDVTDTNWTDQDLTETTATKTEKQAETSLAFTETSNTNDPSIEHTAISELPDSPSEITQTTIQDSTTKPPETSYEGKTSVDVPTETVSDTPTTDTTRYTGPIVIPYHHEESDTDVDMDTTTQPPITPTETVSDKTVSLTSEDITPGLPLIFSTTDQSSSSDQTTSSFPISTPLDESLTSAINHLVDQPTVSESSPEDHQRVSPEDGRGTPDNTTHLSDEKTTTFPYKQTSKLSIDSNTTSTSSGVEPVSAISNTTKTTGSFKHGKLLPTLSNKPPTRRQQSTGDVKLQETIRFVFKGVPEKVAPIETIMELLDEFFRTVSYEMKTKDDLDWMYGLKNISGAISFENRKTFIDFEITQITYELTEISTIFTRFELKKFFSEHANVTFLAQCRVKFNCQYDPYEESSRSSVFEENAPAFITVIALCSVCILILLLFLLYSHCSKRGTWKAPDAGSKIPASRRHFNGNQSPFTDAQIMKDEMIDNTSFSGSAKDGDTSLSNTWVIPLDQDNGTQKIEVAITTEDTKF